jgi:hypothetical protein
MKKNTEQKDKIAYPSCVLPMPGTPPVTNRKQQIIRKKNPDNKKFRNYYCSKNL